LADESDHPADLPARRSALDRLATSWPSNPISRRLTDLIIRPKAPDHLPDRPSTPTDRPLGFADQPDHPIDWPASPIS
jgi:hypothetical protein